MRFKRKLDLIFGMSDRLNHAITGIIFTIIFSLLCYFTSDIGIKVVFGCYTVFCLLFAIRDIRRYYLKKILDGK